MPSYVALLRAVNVGGTGKLAMTDLRDVCESVGFERARTYIQSGNVVFESKLTEPKVKAKLEKALSEKMGKPVVALVRTASELRAAIRRNPFPDAASNQVIVVFLDAKPSAKTLATIVVPGREKVEAAGREVFVHYPDGMGRSKLKLPFAKEGTGRNLNTVAKLAAMADGEG